MKKLINILLILVLLVTILPIKQVGNALFNNQWTEELNEHSENPVEKQSQLAKWACLSGAEMLYSNHNFFTGQTASFYALSQTLPPQPAGDIISPPPNLPL